MNWANYTLIGMYILALGISLGTHGKPRSPENFWSTLLSAVITIGLLYAGGFFV